MDTQKLFKEPLYLKAYDAVIHLILSGFFKPGQKITETYLSELLGISSTPVREAMRKLEHVGLLQNISHSFQITHLEIKDIDDLYICRIALETIAIESAIERIKDADIHELEQILITSEDMGRKGDFLSIIQESTKFHDKIIDIADNPWLINVFNIIRRPLLLARIHLLSINKEIPRVVGEHRAIWEALKQNDKSIAVHTLQSHLKADCEHMKLATLELANQENNDSN